MGCDGGTIPTRDELVKLKKKPEKKDKDSERVAKWKHCTITQEALRQPIVACELGNLYNKDAVIEFLLDKSKFEAAANYSHIRGLKDVKELQLSENPAFDKSTGDHRDQAVDPYLCPVTGIEMKGRFRFCFIFTCGCVVSERAMKEVKSEVCHKCGKTFEEENVVILNGNEEDFELMAKRMDERRLKAKMAKKSKRKQKAEAATSSQDEAPSTKQAKLETDKPRPSKAASGAGSSKPRNGTSKLADGQKESKYTSIQKDPKASNALKSLFTTCEEAKNRPTAHWVTYNPCHN